IVSMGILTLSACKKDNVLSLDDELQFVKLEAITISSTSAVSGSGNATDSLYAMDACKKGNKKTRVEQSSLSASITTYLSANYPGNTFLKAYQIANQTTSVIEGFVVVVQFNEKPVAIKFDASGIFLKVLEIREGRNMKGKGGWHAGGLFDNRDGKQRDTLAISAIPSAIKAYMLSTHPADTLVHAFVNKDQSIILISRNIEFYATSFTTANVFIKRIQLPAGPAKVRSIEASALPSKSSAYLNTTYPNYVFKKAFELKVNGALKGYLVLIDANLTKYAIHFDASGQFLKAVTIR
ncbi:MAG: PepSY-like domain-containing protein, partial [Sphingobacterium thalpophilum]